MSQNEITEEAPPSEATSSQAARTEPIPNGAPEPPPPLEVVRTSPDEAELRRAERAERAKLAAAVAASMDRHDSYRFRAGMFLIAAPVLCFMVAAVWVLTSSEWDTTRAIVLLSIALFSAACFALAARLTTRESALIKMSSKPPEPQDQTKLLETLIKAMTERSS